MKFRVPNKMWAILTTGNGGYDKLKYCQVPVPQIQNGEALVQVLAAGVNNTEINTRLGWYSKTVTDATSDTEKVQNQKEEHKEDGGWNEATPFPFIQGTDCCGRVVAGKESLLGKRVLIRPCQRPHGFSSMENVWMASDFDGAFAQYVKVNEDECFAVDCEWSDAELGSLPCAYGTAENMVHRARVRAGHVVLVPGGSGGVASAVIQLAKRRGAIVYAITSRGKEDLVKDAGADRVFFRGDDLLSIIGKESVDVVVDNVAGEGFPTLLELMKRGGVYVTSGAIAGPMLTLDTRTMYLKDLTLIGCTGWDEPVFPNLVSYIERGEIKPLVSATYPLKDIVQAQTDFLEKKHVGKLVLIPPTPANL